MAEHRGIFPFEILLRYRSALKSGHFKNGVSEMKRQTLSYRFRSQLRVEHLEQRQLMAGLTATLNPSTKTLTIDGTDQADVVAITQNDASNRIIVDLGQSMAVSQHFAAHQVARVVVRLGDGDDELEYKTVGNVWNRKEIRIDFGNGDDTGSIRWAEDGGVARSRLNLSVQGGEGSDAFGARIGRRGFATITNVRADMGAGDDGFVVQALNSDAALADLIIDAIGGDGDDDLQYFASGSLARTAKSTIRLDGRAGDDSLTFNNQGEINGELKAALLGGLGNDSIHAAAVEGAGSGSYRMRAVGDEGDDHFSIDVRAAGNGTYRTQAIVDGGAGKDMSFTPSLAIVSNIEDSSPVTPQTRPTPYEPFDPVLPTRTIRAAHRTIEYWSVGRSEAFAPVVVLLTGAGGSIDSWLPIATTLNDVGQVIAINKPGIGRTSATIDAAYNVTVIEDLRTVVSRVAPGRQVILVGHSLGGAYANLFARMYPTEVAGVVFADSTHQIQLTQDEADVEFNSPAMRVYPAGIRAEFASIAASISAPLSAPEFPKIPVISLSQRLPPGVLAHSQELADLGFPGSLQVIADAGHFLHYDQPQVVIDAIESMVRKTEISGILAEVAAKYGVPGLSASVIIGGRVLTGVGGVRVAGTTAAVQATDRFGIGSNAKAMTATLAGILIERGKLRWDSTLSQLFPELRSTMQPGYLNVTIEQLLQHRGGIIADEDASVALAEKVAAYTGPATQSRLVLLPEILKEPLPGSVGEYRYSNAGYAAAGAMMERATGIPYERLMQRYIFNPLGMYSATFDPPVSDPINPRQPIGHLPDGTPAPGDRPPEDYLGDVLRPAGADLRMNVADWSKFVRIHLGGSVNGFRLVKLETLARLQSPIPIAGDELTLGYAMGWGVYNAEVAGLDPRIGRVLSHSGSDGVWLAEVNSFPEIDFSIQILANGTVDQDGNDLSVSAFVEIKQRLLQRFLRKID